MTPSEPVPDIRPRPRSLFGAPFCDDLDRLEAEVAFIGVPYDQGTTNRPGARFGPSALREVSTSAYNYFGYMSELTGDLRPASGLFLPDTGREALKGVRMADCGDIAVVPADVEKTFDRLTRTVRKLLEKGALPVLLGGDHSITFPAVRAYEGRPALDIVHFDAHTDYAHDYQGVRYTHGSPLRRCAELPFVRHITSIGVRVARRETFEEARARGNTIITADGFRALGPEGAIAQVPPAQALYITIDIDVLDPVYAPGTGTPVPGGLTFLELREALRLLAQRGRVVGVDLVEVAPPYDWAEVTARQGAHLLAALLAALFPG